jgi:phosphatidylserine/phosphatidylglycerophosphate/cardiolipin synthase-like enzyme
VIAAQAASIAELPPSSTEPEGRADWKTQARAFADHKKAPAADQARLAERLEQYLVFLGIGVGENAKVLDRLNDSAPQFLLCDDLEDWACLERPSTILPGNLCRRDSEPGLGDAVKAGETFAPEFYFTRRWDNFDPASEQAPRTLEKILADKIRQDGTRGIDFALYGIDDVTGTMKDVYDSLLSAQKSGAPVRGVVDSEAFGAPNLVNLAKILGQPKIDRDEVKQRFDLSYLQSSVPPGKLWIFDPRFSTAMYQYKETSQFARSLNQSAASEEEAPVRLEWPDSAIMHDKMLVLQDDRGERSVWTGTANISRTCLGDEQNANMSIYFRNTVIAEQAFLPEIQEMMSGKFHQKKRANTHRYFTFGDGTEVRVLFSPTDDAEHRAILPALLSARAGDEIRVSMFGQGGIEYVRAFQYAIARGADVSVVVDRALGNGLNAWYKDKPYNLSQPNPYAIAGQAPGKLAYYFSTWRGLNHHKTATITRRLPGGGHVAEILLVGSQNWSATGNDENDENMLVIRNRAHGVPAAQAFNDEFDRHLVPAARDGK